MDPKMIEYIRENRGKYTDQAIRENLIAAGHDPEKVEAALASLETAQDAPATPNMPGPHYWRWAFAIQLAVLLIVVLWYSSGSDPHGYVTAIIPILGIALLLGMAVTGSIGKFLLPRTGLVVALLLPLISAAALGGWCLRIMGTIR